MDCSSDTFLTTEFEGGRRCRKTDKINRVRKPFLFEEPACHYQHREQTQPPSLNHFFTDTLAVSDPDLFIQWKNSTGSKTRIELIASENIVSRAVLEAQSSILTNKYAEAIQDEGTTAAARVCRCGRE